MMMVSCAKIYYSPDAFSIAKNHNIIAIVPPAISIQPSKKMDGTALIEQQKAESINFQKEIYSWLLKRKSKGQITQEIQDIETTNALLKKAGYPDTPLTTAEICQTLGVDGLIVSSFSLTKPMSEAGAVALAALTGTFGSTNQVSAKLSINDCSSKKLIFNFDHTFSGSVGSNPASLVDDLMRIASKKMPYFN
jgi:hypothetical protein